MKAWSWGWRGRGGGLFESRADIAYYHRLGGFNKRHVFPPRAGGWKSEIKESAGLVLPELLSLACRRPPSSVSPGGLPTVCMCPWCLFVHPKFLCL